jgi:hypothetical protein
VTAPTDDLALARAATDVLVANWAGGHTVPSRTQYPHQWSWDSAFIAMGLRHLSARRAQRELESLFGAQWADGRVPQIVFDPNTPLDAYFPGPDFWRSTMHPAAPLVATSGLIQPPVHALAGWETYRAAPAEARRRNFLGRLYPRLVAWHDYLLRCRTPPGSDLVAAVHPWESGMDNSPSWDEPLARIEPVPVTRFRRRDLQHAAHTDRPTDLDYGRYVRLAVEYRDGGYADRFDSLGFAVLDPMMNALLAVSEEALALIAVEIGAAPAPHRARAARLRDALQAELYDPAEGLFFARDVRSGRLLRHRTVASLMPLLLPGLPVAGSVVKAATSEHFRLGHTALVPSYDLTGPAFDPSRYWRGPGWFSTTWLLWRALTRQGEIGHADRLRTGMLESARREGFREYVDPISGHGRGIRDFSWTAALVLDLLRSDTTPVDERRDGGSVR